MMVDHTTPQKNKIDLVGSAIKSIGAKSKTLSYKNNDMGNQVHIESQQISNDKYKEDTLTNMSYVISYFIIDIWIIPKPNEVQNLRPSK